MRRPRSALLLAIVATTVVMLSGVVATAPADAIEGGESTPTQFPWLVQLGVETNPGDIYDCTGSLIDPQWILTAGHCVPSGTTSVKAKLLRDAGAAPGAAPEASAASWSRSDAADVALIKLAKPYAWNEAKDGPLPRLSTMHDDTTATTYGFGNTAAFGDFDTKTSWPKAKSALLSLDQTDTPNFGVLAGWEGLRKGFYKGTMFTRTIVGSSTRGHTLPGDSGGPLLQYGAIVGVTTTPGILSALKFQSERKFKTKMFSTSGTSISSSIEPAYTWILKTTGLPDSQLASDRVMTKVTGVALRFDDTWLSSVRTKGGTNPAQLTSNPAGKSLFTLSFDATGSFQIIDANNNCLQVTSDPIVSDTGLALFQTNASFVGCEFGSQKQKWALRNGTTATGTDVGYAIANAGAQLYLSSSNPNLDISTRPQTVTLSSTSTEFASTLAKYAALRALSPLKVKRDLPTTNIGVSFPGGASPVVPALPSGVKAVDVQTATQGGTSFIYALGDDGKLYTSTSQGPAGSAYKPWSVRPQPGITQMSTATSSSGTIYTDGVNLYATYGGKFPDLPDRTGIVQIGAAIDDRGLGSIYVLGTNGVLYGRTENSGWNVIDRDVDAMAPSEVDSSVAYSVGGGVSYSSPKVNNAAPVRLPALPTGTGVSDLRLSAQGDDTFVYVLGWDGRVYKGRASNQNWAGARWEQRPGTGIDGLRTATVQGGAIYTDGKSVFPTFGDNPFTALPAGVKIADVAFTVDPGEKGNIYVLSTSGDLYRMSYGQSSWTQLNPPSVRVLTMNPSQTEGSLIYTSTPR